MRQPPFPILALLALPLGVQCSGTEFRSGGGNEMGGSQPGGSGGSGGSSAGAGGATAGAGMGGSSAGSGGAPCSCGPGQYCRAGSCLDCADFSSLEFSPPEPLLDHPSEPLRFPRAGPTATSLFYRLGAPGAGQVWYSPDVFAMPGAFAGSPMAVEQSGALYFGDRDALGFDVFLDETADGRRSARTANWDGQSLVNVALAPPPLSPGGFDDYDIAFAAETERAHWTSTRDGRVTLRTGVVGGGDADEVDIELTGPAGPCPRPPGDPTPWTTADGELLLFRSFPVDSSCAPSDGSATDLYIAPLDAATGQPSVAAFPLSGANVSSGGSSETDASFSADRCALYFASDRGSSAGDFALFRSARR